MKKLLLFALALLTLNTVNANLLLHESFDRPTGNLYKDDFQNMGSNTTDWFWFLAGSTDIQVTEGSLAYSGYVESGIGNKANLKGGSGKYKDLRQYAKITSGSVYVAAIINVETLKNATTADYFLALGDGTSSNMYARVYTSSVKEGDNWVGFKLGIQKNNENSGARGYSETIYSVNTDYLIVAEYQFVDGTQNDTVRLYVNPTKNKKVPVAQCGQVFMIGDNNKGAGAQSDAAYLSSVNLRPSTATPTSMYVDEIKVATAWEDLFTGGGDTPVEEPAEITVTPTSFGYLQGYVGETYTKTFTVNGKNLKEDITLTSSSEEVTLDKYTISKDAATDVVVTMTIKPQTDDYGAYVVTLKSGDATATVTQSYWNIKINEAATIAELNAFAATASGYDYVYIKFTGKAVISYQYNQSGNKLYIQDATAGVFINDSYWGDAVKQGDSISNFIVYADALNAVGGMMYIGTEGTNISVLSHDNEVTPKVVTLAELQANPADYLCQLVKVEGVTFANTDAFASGDEIQQGGATATINLIAGNDLIGAVKPAKADITAISSATTGKVLRVRGKQDVVAASTAIDNIATDAEMEIYTVSGMRVSELQPGVNIIRQGNKTYKVVR